MILVLGMSLRLLYLDADPDYYAWVGYVTDEGRWLRNARQVALFGHLIDPDRGLHIHLAPLFHVVHIGLFKLLGVSFLTARLFTAVAGCALLVVGWIALRRFAAPGALLVALLLLAFEVDLVAMSRVGIPEMPAMLLLLASFVVLVTPPPGAIRMLIAGFLLLLAVATKATVLPVLPIFAALAFALGSPGVRRRGRDLAVFLAGFGAPVLVVGILALIRPGLVKTETLANSLRIVRHFIEPSELYALGSLPFEGTLAPVFNVWGVAACFAFVGWMASPRDGTASSAYRWYVASLVWFGAYMVVMATLDYFPARYRLHSLIPLAFNIAAGLTLFQQLGLTGVSHALPGMPTAKRLVVLAALACPVAAFWAPLLAAGYHTAGWDGTRLRVWIIALAVALATTTAVLARRVRRGASLLPFVVMPTVAALAWVVSDRVDVPGLPFWPAVDRGAWTWALAVGWWALGGAWALTGIVARRTAPWQRRMIPVAAATYAFLSIVRILPSYAAPQYTMREASEDIGRRLAGLEFVESRRADGLFNGNALRYRLASVSAWRSDAVVVAFDPVDPRLERDYRLVKEYELFISPLYDGRNDGAEPLRAGLPVRLYVRQTPGGATDAPR